MRYCAEDVVPLHDLHCLTEILISKDFRPLFEDLCNINLIRPADKNLPQKKLKWYSKQNLLFFSNLDSNVRRVDFYKLLAEENVSADDKIVLHSPRDHTAHIIFENTNAAVSACDNIESKVKDFLGHAVEMKLITTSAKTEEEYNNLAELCRP